MKRSHSDVDLIRPAKIQKTSIAQHKVSKNALQQSLGDMVNEMLAGIVTTELKCQSENSEERRSSQSTEDSGEQDCSTKYSDDMSGLEFRIDSDEYDPKSPTLLADYKAYKLKYTAEKLAGEQYDPTSAEYEASVQDKLENLTALQSFVRVSYNRSRDPRLRSKPAVLSSGPAESNSVKVKPDVIKPVDSFNTATTVTSKLSHAVSSMRPESSHTSSEPFITPGVLAALCQMMNTNSDNIANS